jgi:hypothetical protein
MLKKQKHLEIRKVDLLEELCGLPVSLKNKFIRGRGGRCLLRNTLLS